MMKRLLVLSPHTDDAELGAGGTIVRLIGEGVSVHSVAFSCGTAGEDEFYQAQTALGLFDGDVELLDFPTRCFPKYRQGVLEKLIEMRDDLRPDAVLCPSSYDTHQDHQVIRDEAFRAFKQTTIWGYEQPWNQRTLDPRFFVPLSEVELQTKQEAIDCYRSQIGRRYTWNEKVKSLAQIRGLMAGVPFAEAFEVIRWIL